MNKIEILKLVENVKWDGEGGGAQHEFLISDILKDAGMKQIDKKDLGTMTDPRKESLRNEDLSVVDLPVNTFVREPMGHLATIDFLINAGGEMFVLEAKSSTGAAVRWNDNPPKSSFYYLISVKGRGNTLIKGSEWVTKEEVDSFISCGETLKEIFKSLNENPELDFEDVVNDFRSAFENARTFAKNPGFRYAPRRYCEQDSKHFKDNTK